MLIAVGGAEDREGDRVVLRAALGAARERAGAEVAVTIVPTASGAPHAVCRSYLRAFASLGAADVAVVGGPGGPALAERAAAERVAASGLVWLAGGDQSRLVARVSATPTLAALRACAAAGRVIAGTSAGATALSTRMIARGHARPPGANCVDLSEGFGLTRTFVIDQHFSQRGRFARLMTATLVAPAAVGLGVDEDTAAFLVGDDVVRVVGSGTVTVVDARAARCARGAGRLSARDVIVHVLVPGDRWSAAPTPPR